MIHFMRGLFRYYYGGLSFEGLCGTRGLSSSEVVTALRPFYFAVHPDLFGQHPKEREVNENSLKQLMSFLETAQQNRPVRPMTVTFFLRKTVNIDNITALSTADTFREIRITLLNRDVKSTVRQVLESCNISTDFINKLPETHKEIKMDRPIVWHHSGYQTTSTEDPEEKINNAKVTPMLTLSSWLFKNSAQAGVRLELCRPIREETQRLRNQLIDELQLQDIVWDCGWGITHFRGCLQSLSALSKQHVESMNVLKGRTLVFERITGVNLQGHVILSSEDVRHTWLEMIKVLARHDQTLSRIPAVQETVSRVLRDIQVVHRKFQPAVIAQSYETQLRKLSAALADHWVKYGYPQAWPSSLKYFQLVVECDAGPLMLSPTGQFIVPASCPAFLIVKFMSENLHIAQQRLELYNIHKHEERELQRRCIKELHLTELWKDDSVTPEMMITFCKRILERQTALHDFLQGMHVCVSQYYSILQGGEMCIPWNFED